MNAVDLAALEDARYAAMLAGDTIALRKLCSARLHYSHSFGDRDTLDNWLEKIEAREIVYHQISWPAEWVEHLPGVALVGGRMTARASVGGVQRRIDNAFLAVWADEGDAWRLVAYQPTPLPG